MVSLKIQKEKRAGLQFTSPDYLSLLLTPLRIRWTIPLRQKNVAYPYPQNTHCQELISESPFTSMADNFPAFPARNYGL
jgi:hypothetical protein